MTEVRTMTGTVKALAWEERRNANGPVFYAKTSIDWYIVATASGEGCQGTWYWFVAGDTIKGWANSEGEAKAAAHADYERRVLSALTASASEPTISDAQISTVWQGAMTVALNLIIKRENDLNDDDGPMDVLNELREIIARLRPFLTPDASYIEELRTILPASACEPAKPEVWRFTQQTIDGDEWPWTYTEKQSRAEQQPVWEGLAVTVVTSSEKPKRSPAKGE